MGTAKPRNASWPSFLDATREIAKMASLLPVSGAELLSSSGIDDDGWCEPLVSIRLRTVANTKSGSIRVWFPGEPEKPRSVRFAVQVDSDDPFVCEISSDMLTDVVFSCDRPARTRIEVAMLCERRVSDKGADIRDLSFKADCVSFG